MIEGVDLSAAKQVIAAKLKAEYSILPPGHLDKMVAECLSLDSAFMEATGVTAGEAYDDDKAFEAILKGLSEAFAEHKMYCMRFVEDYMDAFEEYLEQSGVLEWE